MSDLYEVLRSQYNHEMKLQLIYFCVIHRSEFNQDSGRNM
jgi:hypothetical protein